MLNVNWSFVDVYRQRVKTRMKNTFVMRQLPSMRKCSNMLGLDICCSITFLVGLRLKKAGLRGGCYQSHYIEVVEGVIFMQQKMKFGLILGWLAVLKKIGNDYKQLLRAFFFMFYSANIFFSENITASPLQSCIKCLLHTYFLEFVLHYCATPKTQLNSVVVVSKIEVLPRL